MIGTALAAFGISALVVLWIEGWPVLLRIAGPLLAGAAGVIAVAWRLGRPSRTRQRAPVEPAAKVSAIRAPVTPDLAVVASSAPETVDRAVTADGGGNQTDDAGQQLRFYAQELHDESIEAVSAIRSMGVSISRRAQDPAITQASELIVQTAEQLQSAINDVLKRRRDEPEDGRDLANALTQLVRQVESNAVAEVPDRQFILRIAPDVNTADADVGNAVHQFVAHALDNAVVHSGAQIIEVNVWLAAGRILAQVSDNGVGLPATLPKQTGLDAMADRAATVGGTVEIGKSRLGGVAARVSCPLVVNKAPARQWLAGMG